ncbi:response regulator transcription factor [Flammeovirga sp. MY04]|uniref:LytR/AlgR family response regulator transcription factor n=1 Tax=Flammeovirga sp. MY04 TaxID=1191459 RepID=UPI0008063D1F|nr:LytTR family DNA-binding domain-containing protein [Flammeovirga sp. MY04]ANQ52819.1 response regulator transcription factor [Flammeovirga sp. MY04]
MKALIIEDEKPAQGKLVRQINKTPFEVEVVKFSDSIKKSVDWLKLHQQDIDLIFMDIHLTDGLAFDILKEVNIIKPIIFTTAYDEYALEAFKVNSIDYLLKPVDSEALTKALQKLELLQNQSNTTQKGQIDALIENYNQKYKNRFIVRIGDSIKSILSQDIVAFVADGKHTLLYNKEGRRYYVDFKMEELNDLLDPSLFFRIGRSYFVQKQFIQKVDKYTNSRLQVVPSFEIPHELIVVRDKVKEFKEWLEK